MPKSAARSEPTAFMTVRTSSIRTSRLGMSGTRSDRPVPRLSKRIRRENAASTSKAARILAAVVKFDPNPQAGNRLGVNKGSPPVLTAALIDLQVQLADRDGIAFHVVQHELLVVRGAVLLHHHAKLLHARG